MPKYGEDTRYDGWIDADDELSGIQWAANNQGVVLHLFKGKFADEKGIKQYCRMDDKGEYWVCVDSEKYTAQELYNYVQAYDVLKNAETNETAMNIMQAAGSVEGKKFLGEMSEECLRRIEEGIADGAFTAKNIPSTEISSRYLAEMFAGVEVFQGKTDVVNAVREAVKDVLRPAEITETKPAKTQKEAIRTFGTRLLRLYETADGSKREARALVEKFVEDAIRSGHVTDEAFDKLTVELNNLSAVTVRDYDEDSKKDAVRGRRIYVSEKMRSEFAGEYDKIRKRAWAAGLTLTSDRNAKGPDTHYQELSEMYPGDFPADVWNDADELKIIIDVAEASMPRTVSLYDSYKDAYTSFAPADEMIADLDRRTWEAIYRLKNDLDKVEHKPVQGIRSRFPGLTPADREASLQGSFSIAYTEENEPFVIVEKDILDGVPRKKWNKTVRDNLKANFPEGVKVPSGKIKINAMTRNEITESRYSKWLREHMPGWAKDKLKATDNLDEIIKAATNWKNEEPNHQRNDFQSFARGDVLIRVGSQDYKADVVVGNKSNGEMVMYDIVYMVPTTIKNRSQQNASTNNGIHIRSAATDSMGIVAENGNKVNSSSSVFSATDKRYMDAVNAGDMQTAQEMVDEAAEAAMQSSTVRDTDGKLLPVYHGGTKNYTVFDRTKGRSTMDIQGTFFSPWEEDAQGYGANVRRFYLNITNPATEGQGFRALNRYKGQNDAGVKAREYLEAMGYDGVGAGEDAEEYIVFDPENIKSADPVTYDDNGKVIPLSERFNAKSPDVRFSISSAPAVTPEERRKNAPELGWDRAVFAEDGELPFSIAEIQGQKEDYGTGVVLDTNIFQNVSPRNWGKVLRNYVYENMAGKELVIYDEDGNAETVYIARENDRVRKDGSNNYRKVIDKLARSTGDNIRTLSVVHADELLATSRYEKTTDENNHQWMDQSGWEIRKTYIEDRAGTIYEATLNIAQGRDRNILYDINNIHAIDKMKATRGDVPSTVAGRGSLTSGSSRDGSITETSGNVKGSFSISSATDKRYMDAVNAGDMQTAQEMVDEAAEAAMQSSTVRDADGKLLPVYHGGTKNYTVFDRTKGRSTMDIQGTFFSPWEEEAQGYGANVRRFYLNITNPATEGQGFRALNRYKGQNDAGVKAREYLKAMGYDGVGAGEDAEEYIVFDPENIKSADPVTYDDNGKVIPLSERFNAKSPDVRFSISSAPAVTPDMDYEEGIVSRRSGSRYMKPRRSTTRRCL